MRLPIVPADLVEGAELVEIQLGHLCNNRCVFCSSGQATALGQARPIDEAPVRAALDQAKQRRARKVTFLGGEPTLQRAFLPALRYATSLGFEEIEIFTNGVKAARKSFVDEVAAIGRFSWRFSIQGGNEEAHDLAVAKAGAFARICRAMKHVGSHGHRITANACINEHSYRSLPDYVELVRRYEIMQLHVDVVRPSSAGTRSDAYLEEIMPMHTAMAPYFEEMLRRFEAWDPSFDVNVGNVPFCVLPSWAHRVHHGGQETLTVASDPSNGLSAKDKYAVQHADKVRGSGCEQCLFTEACSGVFDAYARIHGLDELRPVDAQDLQEQDPNGRAWAWHVADWVRALETEGGRVVVHDPIGRIIRVDFDVGRVVIKPVASVRAKRLIVAKSRYGGMSIEVDSGTSVDAMTRWIDSLRACIAPPMLAPRSTWIGAAMGASLGRGRRRVRHALATLGARLHSQTPDEQWPGVHANIEAEGGVRVDIRVVWGSGTLAISVPPAAPRWVHRWAQAHIEPDVSARG